MLLIVLASLIAADLESPRPTEVTNVVRQNVFTWHYRASDFIYISLTFSEVARDMRRAHKFIA